MVRTNSPMCYFWCAKPCSTGARMADLRALDFAVRRGIARPGDFRDGCGKPCLARSDTTLRWLASDRSYPPSNLRRRKILVYF